MEKFEVEIKSLLTTKERRDFVVKKLFELDSNSKLVSSNKQLNHYFVGGNLNRLPETTGHLFSKDFLNTLKDFINKISDFSLRTRQKDNEVIFVLKASIGDGTSANGVSRLELEESVQTSLKELDTCLLNAGFDYQAKWSRERDEYISNNINVCFDKNAGYGYLAEFEKVVDDARAAELAKKELYEFMNQVGIEELDPERLKRMFNFYNENWKDYYGSDKTFVLN